MRGLELVECRRSKAPAKAQAARLLERCRERGLLLGKGGLHGNVIRRAAVTMIRCRAVAACSRPTWLLSHRCLPLQTLRSLGA